MKSDLLRKKEKEKRRRLKTYLLHVVKKIYFLVPQFQFASQMVPKIWKKKDLVPPSIFFIQYLTVCHVSIPVLDGGCSASPRWPKGWLSHLFFSFFFFFFFFLSFINFNLLINFF
jgi:hypothetical protein